MRELLLSDVACGWRLPSVREAESGWSHGIWEEGVAVEGQRLRVTEGDDGGLRVELPLELDSHGGSSVGAEAGGFVCR